MHEASCRCLMRICPCSWEAWSHNGVERNEELAVQRRDEREKPMEGIVMTIMAMSPKRRTGIGWVKRAHEGQGKNRREWQKTKAKSERARRGTEEQFNE